MRDGMAGARTVDGAVFHGAARTGFLAAAKQAARWWLTHWLRFAEVVGPQWR